VDTIIGKGHRQAIVSLTERKSHLSLLRKVERRTTDLVSEAVIDLLQPILERLHTIPGDNGKEFVEYERISRELNTDTFYAHPFSAWERGTNENMNGLVRQYIPKQREFVSITDPELLSITNRLNHRPRKYLDFMTPFEVFFEHPVALDS
jgi:IS30 family transposase